VKKALLVDSLQFMYRGFLVSNCLCIRFVHAPCAVFCTIVYTSASRLLTKVSQFYPHFATAADV